MAIFSLPRSSNRSISDPAAVRQHGHESPQQDRPRLKAQVREIPLDIGVDVGFPPLAKIAFQSVWKARARVVFPTWRVPSKRTAGN